MKMNGDKMHLLINFSTLKAGGGQNVAMNFLYAIDKIQLNDINIFYFVAQNSQPHKFLETKGMKNYFVVASNPIKRILFEIIESEKMLKQWDIDIIYSYFGYGFFPKEYKQVVGSADSNLYFPEIDFWKDYKGLSRIKKYLVDQYRIFGIKQAISVVFENSALEERGTKIYKLKNTVTIKPSINMSFNDEKFIFPNSIRKDIFKGLFLCGWHMNKNVLKIPEIAFYLKKAGVDFQFILTAPIYKTNDIYIQFMKLVEKYEVQKMCFVVGQVNKEELKSLYEQVDFVFLLSKLESFSNNIIESWYFQKPLIVSNEEWAYSICKKAAYYVNRDNAKEIALKIEQLLKNQEKIDRIISTGLKELKNYPSIEERINIEMEYLYNVYKNY